MSRLSNHKDCPFCVNNALLTVPVEDLNAVFYAIDTNNPKAEFHKLVIPYRHWDRFDHMDWQTQSMMMLAIGDLVKQHGLSQKGYRIVINVGMGGKQKMWHVHAHVLAGEGATEEGVARSV